MDKTNLQVIEFITGMLALISGTGLDYPISLTQLTIFALCFVTCVVCSIIAKRKE